MVGMNSCQKLGKHYEYGQSRLGSLLSLSALLPYFFLPLVFFIHLTNYSFPAASADPGTGTPAIEARTQEPDLPHDSNTCPICRAASDFQNHGLFLSFHAPEGLALAGPLSGHYDSSGLAKADAPIWQSRAPPGVSLLQTTV